MVMRPTRAPLPGRRMAEAAFDELVELEPLDVLVAEVPEVVVGGAVGDDVVFVGTAPETETLLPIVVTVVQDDVGGAG